MIASEVNQPAEVASAISQQVSASAALRHQHSRMMIVFIMYNPHSQWIGGDIVLLWIYYHQYASYISTSNVQLKLHFF